MSITRQIAADTTQAVKPSTRGVLGGLWRAARRAAGLASAAGSRQPVGVASLFERLEERQLLTVDIAATIGTFTAGALTASGANQNLTGTVVLTNVGNQPVAGAAWRVFLSPLAGGTDITVGTGSLSMLPGTGNARTINLNTLPLALPNGGFAAGAYTLNFALTNAGDIDDANVANNTVTAGPLVAINGPAGADLTATNLAIATQTVAPGTPLTGNNSVVFRNTGSVNAVATTARWVISRDRNLGNALNLTQSGQAFAAMNSGSSTTITPSALTVPSGVAAGTYFVGLVLDSNGEVTEGNEGNNVIWTSAASVTVALPELSATITYPGQTINVNGPIPNLGGSFMVRNTGNSAAQNFNVRVFVTDEAGIEGPASIELLRPTGVLTITNLAVGASQTFSLADFEAPSLLGINAGIYSIQVRVDSSAGVLESNENNNDVATATPSLVFVESAGAPDLRVTVTNPAANATVGQEGTLTGVTVTVLRSGGQVSNQNGLRPSLLIGLSLVNTTAAQYIALSTSELTAGQVNTLNTTGSLTLSNLTLALPVGVDAVDLGSYFVAAFIDLNQDVGETNEVNNLSFATQKVAVAAPELSGSFTLSPATQTLQPGEALSLSVTLRNTAAIASGAFAAQVLLVSASDGELFPSQVGVGQLLGEVRPVFGAGNAGLSAGQTLTLSDVRLSLPTTIRPGAYRLVMIVDSGEEVFESNEGNNNTFSTGAVVTVPARGADASEVDLAVTGPQSLSVTRVGSDTIVRGRITVANLGDTAATSGRTVRAYLSSDRQLDLNDFVLSDDVYNGALGALLTTGTLTGDVQFTAASNAPEGQFYLILVIDPDDEQVESSGSNNVWISPGLIATINSAVSPAANLSATTGLTGTTNVQRGGNLSVPTTVRNTGAASAGASAVRYILTTNDIIGDSDDIVLADVNGETSFAVGAINAGLTATLSPTLVIPANLPSGVSAYRLVIQVDSGRQVAESNEADNTVVGTAAAAVNVTAPNLTATTSFVALTTSRGANVNIPAIIRNTGIIGVSGETTARFALRPIAAVNASQDIVLGTRVIGALAAGSSESFTQSFTLPSAALDLPAGDYRVVVIADVGGVVLETSEIDNTVVSAALLRIAAPNLTVNVPTTTVTTIGQGAVLAASVVVRNIAAAAAGAFNVRLFLSADGTLNPNTDILLSVQRLTGLAGNGSQTLSFSSPVPGSATAGTYFLIAEVDGAGEVEELVENDNSSQTTTARVTVTGATQAGADLTARPLITAPLALATGSSVQIPVQFSNVGTADTSGATTGRLLLSSDATADGNDLVIGTFSIPDGLRPGSQQVVVDAIIPGFAGAGRYFLIAVADAGDTVTETNENNNAGVTATALATVSRPVVSVTATTAAAAETTGGQAARPGTFRVTRSGPTTGSLTVNVALGGTATITDDFTTAPGAAAMIVTVTIPAGQAFATFSINPVDDGVIETLTETVVATVARGDGYNIGGTPATVNITDRQTAPTLTITATDAVGAETAFGTVVAQQNRLNFRLTRAGGTLSQPLVVLVTWSAGVAVNGEDFGTEGGQALPTSFTIPANVTTLNIPVFVLSDVLAEGSETVVATIDNAGQPYRVSSEATRRATGTITNTLLGDARLVSTTGLTSPSNIALTQPGQSIDGAFTVRTTGPAQAVTYRYVLSTDATAGNADDIVLGSEVLILQPGADQVVSFTASLDGISFIPQGSYRFFVIQSPALAQGVERASAIELGTVNLAGARADLSVTGVTLPGNLNYTLGSGANLTVSPSAALANATVGVTARNVGVRYVLSSNGIIGDGDDVAVAGSALAATLAGGGTASTAAFGFNLLNVSGLSAGTWRIGAILGATGDGIANLDNSPNNNTAISTQTITIVQGVDLSAAALVVNATPANTLAIVAGAVSNPGNFNINAVFQNLSNVPVGFTIDLLINTVNNFGVGSGAITLATRNGTAAANSTPGLSFEGGDVLVPGALMAGTYFVALRLTPTGGLVELTANNNLLVAFTQLTITVA